MDKIYNSALKYATHKQIYKFLEQFGEIIVPTHDETNRITDFRTGRRKVRMDVNNDLERWQEIELSAVIEGKDMLVKGKVNLFIDASRIFA